LDKKYSKLKERDKLYRNLHEKTKSIVFISNYITERKLWCPESKYFSNLFGKDYLKNLNTNSENFQENIHPDDKAIFFQKTLQFKKRQSDSFSLLFRMKSKNNHYKWLFLKMFYCDNTAHVDKKRCLCFLTEFNDNLHSKKQIYELNKELRREEEENKDFINEFRREKELEIIKYIVSGKNHKEIQNILNLKNPSVIGNLLDRAYSITNTDNIAALAFCLGQLDIF
jgi:DNA-binding CsgD family transcriptional regulator